MRILAIDPGLSGALAVLESDGTLAALFDLPVIEKDNLAWIDGGELGSLIMAHRGTNGYQAVVEHVGPMPKQGLSSTFKFGVGFGSVLSLLQFIGMPLYLVRPVVWKRAYALKGKDKDAPLNLARLQWPTAELHLKKHHGRAEALLLADWYRTHKQPGG